jgi:hypothetical protein
MGWHPIAKLGFCHQQTGIQVSNWECTIKHCNLTIQNWELNMFEPAKIGVIHANAGFTVKIAIKLS